MARIELIIDKSKPSFRSPYKAVIWDILIRHGYTPAQLEDAEHHFPSSQPIQWSNMTHVIIEFVRYIEQHYETTNH